jgi:hypothetical protein
MSYFSDRREQNYAANKAAIATHKTLSPYADYEGGKYEPMQYEGIDVETLSEEDYSQLQDFTLLELEERFRMLYPDGFGVYPEWVYTFEDAAKLAGTDVELCIEAEITKRFSGLEELTHPMNPIERWEAIGLPSELERIEQLKQGEITAAFLKARWESNNPNGFEFYGEMLDWDGMVGMGFIDVIEAVHDEWAENMPPSLTTIYC